MVPVPHPRHVDNPLASEYDPTAQGVQLDTANELYVPGWHDPHVTEFDDELNLPGLQAEQPIAPVKDS